MAGQDLGQSARVIRMSPPDHQPPRKTGAGKNVEIEAGAEYTILCRRGQTIRLGFRLMEDAQ